MDITQAQVCCSTQPYHTVLVPSSTTPGVTYTITVALPDDPREEWWCSCPSWTYRGYCKHTDMIDLCHWTEATGPEKQTAQQKKDHLCPRCFGPTIDKLIIDNE